VGISRPTQLCHWSLPGGTSVPIGKSPTLYGGGYRDCLVRTTRSVGAYNPLFIPYGLVLRAYVAKTYAYVLLG